MGIDRVPDAQVHLNGRHLELIDVDLGQVFATRAALDIGLALEVIMDADIALHQGFELVENFTDISLTKQYEHAATVFAEME